MGEYDPKEGGGKPADKGGRKPLGDQKDDPNPYSRPGDRPGKDTPKPDAEEQEID